MGTKILSPCISDCRINEYNICMGCGRTIEQIVQWSSYEDDEREKIIKNLEKKDWPGKRHNQSKSNIN